MRKLAALLIMVVAPGSYTIVATGSDFAVTIEFAKQGVVKTKGKEFRDSSRERARSSRGLAAGQAAGNRLNTMTGTV